MSKPMDILLATFSSGVAIQIQASLSPIIHPSLLAFAISSFCGAVLFAALDWGTSLPLRFPFVRRYASPKYGIEGYWFEIVEDAPEHPYSYAYIRYNSKHQMFTYQGTNYRKDFSVHARWSSNLVICDEKKDRILFLFEADLAKGVENIRGHGVLEFQNYIGHVYHCGSGSFVDSGAELKRSMFTAERISGQDLKRILGYMHIAKPDDMLAVVKAKVAEKGSKAALIKC